MCLRVLMELTYALRAQRQTGPSASAQKYHWINVQVSNSVSEMGCLSFQIITSVLNIMCDWLDELNWVSFGKELYYSEKKDLPVLCLFIGCLTSQQHASVSQGRICSILRAATLR